MYYLGVWLKRKESISISGVGFIMPQYDSREHHFQGPATKFQSLQEIAKLPQEIRDIEIPIELETLRSRDFLDFDIFSKKAVPINKKDLSEKPKISRPAPAPLAPIVVERKEDTEPKSTDHPDDIQTKILNRSLDVRLQHKEEVGPPELEKLQDQPEPSPTPEQQDSDQSEEILKPSRPKFGKKK